MKSNNHMHIFKLALCSWIVGKRQIALQTRTRTHKNSSTQFKNPAQRSGMTCSSWPFLVERSIFNLKCIEIFTAWPHTHHLYLPLPSIWKPFIVEEFPALNNVHSSNFFPSHKDSRMTSKKRENVINWFDQMNALVLKKWHLLEIIVARNILQIA